MAESLKFEAETVSHFDELSENYESIDSVPLEDIKIDRYRNQVQTLDHSINRRKYQSRMGYLIAESLWCLLLVIVFAIEARHIIQFKPEDLITEKLKLFLTLLLTFLFFSTYLLLDLRPVIANWMLLGIFLICGAIECFERIKYRHRGLPLACVFLVQMLGIHLLLSFLYTFFNGTWLYVWVNVPFMAVNMTLFCVYALYILYVLWRKHDD